MSDGRPKALVTAAVSGRGLDLLHQLAELVLDSWLDQPSLRIYNAQQLAARAADEGANIVVVESDVCGAELYEQPIIAVASCRGDPNNVDVAAATAAGVPVLYAPGRNADAVAELAIALLFAATRGVVAADKDGR
jgi:D-3-phosphoglycerate dehydrogenase